MAPQSSCVGDPRIPAPRNTLAERSYHPAWTWISCTFGCLCRRILSPDCCRPPAVNPTLAIGHAPLNWELRGDVVRGVLDVGENRAFIDVRLVQLLKDVSLI